ncbi:MAG: hypothetical protein DMD70_03550 [Gemmatimonadetes bacterium]|nr:MAG: hypothetical protein DMD70_03550 [Gemmatimonadota bacterium]
MRAAVFIAACLTAGCYSYTPLTTTDPEPGTSLVTTLTDDGARELARYLGSDVFLVRGRCVGGDELGLRVSVAAVETKGGDLKLWGGEIVTIPAAAIASVEIRRFAKGRSLLLAGVGVAGVAATTLAFSLTGSGSAPGAKPPPPPPK